MADIVFPNLPELDAQLNSVPNPKTAGEWHRTDWNALGKVASSLDLKSQPGAHVIHKLPDIWARVTMVELALSLGNRHPLYATVRDAFRGLVAVVALWKRRQLPFRIETLNLSQFAASPRAGQLFHRDTVERDGAQTLSISHNTKWASPHILMLDNSPIGLASPVTFLCPLFGFEASRAVGGVPWWQDGQLNDPTSHLSADQRAWVARWIESTRVGLAGIPGANTAISTLILGELDRFAAGLDVSAAAGELVQGIPGLANGAYELLTFTAPPVGDHEWSGELVLQSERTDKRLVVLEKKTPVQWNRPAQQISVLPSVTFDAVERRWDDLASGRSDLGRLPDKTDYILAEKLFLPRITMVRVETGEQAFPGAVAVAGSDGVRHKWKGEPLLPVSPTLAEFLDPGKIVGAAEYRPLGDKLRVELRLQLRGGTITVACDYSAEQIAFVDVLPIVEIWPAFASPRWKAYFTFWGDELGRGVFSVSPVYQSGAEVHAPVTERRASNDEPLRHVFRSSHPPLGFNCRLANSDVGMLAVVMPRPEAADNGASWRLGIDFGTTNTTVYYAGSGVAPRLLPLDGLGTHQVTGADKTSRLDWLNRFFLPPREEMPRLPFLTMYRARRSGSAPIQDGNIAFVRAQDRPSLFDPSISSSLKWSEGPADRAKTQALLGETLLLALAQAVRLGVGNVSVTAAYPSAFWPRLRQTLSAAWKNCLSDAQKSVDISLGDGVATMTESEAVAKFFEGTAAATTDQGALIVDIGGGSTDLAYWRENRLLWQASVHLAGKTLLTEALYAVEKSGPTGLKQIESLWPDAAFEAVLQDGKASLDSDRNIYDRQVEALLARAGDEIAERLTHHADNPSLQFVIRHLALGLGGLLWYAGSAQAWNDERHALKPENVNVYTAGNGSRLWHWLTHGTFDQHALSGFIERMTRAGTGRTGGVKLTLSPAPKSEVAAGLVASSPITAVDPWDPNEQVFAGETIKIDGTVKDVLRRDNLVGARSLEVEGLSNLCAMLEAFNSQSTRAGWFWRELSKGEMESLKNDTLSDVRQKVSGWRGAERDELHLEPIFILGLRQLLNRHLALPKT